MSPFIIDTGLSLLELQYFGQMRTVWRTQHLPYQLGVNLPTQDARAIQDASIHVIKTARDTAQSLGLEALTAGPVASHTLIMYVGLRTPDLQNPQGHEYIHGSVAPMRIVPTGVYPANTNLAGPTP